MGCPISTIGSVVASQVVGGLLGGCCGPTTTAQRVGNAVQPIVSAATAFELGCKARSCQQNINAITQAMYDAYMGKQNAIAKGYGVTCGAQPTHYTIGDVPLSQAVQAPTTRTASDIVSMPTSSGGITSINTNAGKVPTLKAAHGGIMSTRHHYELGGSTPIGPAQGSFLNNPNYQQRQASLLNQLKSNPQLGALLKQKLMQTRQKAMPTGFQGGAALNPFTAYMSDGGRAHYDSGGLSDLLQQQVQNYFQNQLQQNLQNQITDAQQSSTMGGLSSLPQDLLDSLKISMGAQGLKTGGIPTGDLRQNQHGIHEIDYRKKGGYVPPIGVKEKADDIPAMLSNNEFVFTADAVRKAGGGDVKEGARRMYALMKHLEGK
jgi:hypothetical protein